MELIINKPGMKFEAIYDKLVNDDVFYNPDGIQIGFISGIEVLERKTREGQEYAQVQFNVKSSDGKNYSKRYSTDFARKYLMQLNVKAAETAGALVVFKPTGQYKNIGWWAFVIGEADDEGDMIYDIQPYKDDTISNVAEKLKKLGL